MKRNGGRPLFSLLGLLFSTLPPAAATLFYFPLFRAGGGRATLSGLVLLLLLFSALPLYRLIRRCLASPAVWQVWLFAFLLFLLLAKIADEMIVISFFGLCGNLVGSYFFRKGEGHHEKL
ncbi:MAG TPA: hypothetical protein DDY70_00730 [Clostridiales bacterium]|nr:hypothetical protein [Clostridiales bacterium]